MNPVAFLASLGFMGAALWWWRAPPVATVAPATADPAAELSAIFEDAFASALAPLQGIATLPAIGAPAASPPAFSGFTEAIYVAAEDIARAFTPGPWQYPAAAAPYVPAIQAAEARHGIPDKMLGRLLYQESRFRADIITGRVSSPAGALGIAQFMPATAAEMGVDPLDPPAAIDAAGAYLRRLYNALGSWQLALAAYNWGIGNVQRKGIERAPAETRAYYTEILRDVGHA